MAMGEATRSTRPAPRRTMPGMVDFSTCSVPKKSNFMVCSYWAISCSMKSPALWYTRSELAAAEDHQE